MMSKRALGKLVVIHGSVEGMYTVKESALRLKVSERRIKRLKKKRTWAMAAV